ncbi:hypothetical protein ACIQU5_29420 [Streptomyces sp. NPDC090306]|uniref:hypothetical protein n=1 Tax=unclassified Streptomyces TaxID=2593676 RepID=UPI0036E5BCD2
MRASSSRPRPRGSLSEAETEVLRVISDARTPVFVAVHADGRRRYSYWRPLDSTAGRGGCYAALPTEVCDTLLDDGRLALGEPLVDRTRTTYRVRAVHSSGPAPAPGPVPAPVRAAQRWARAA